MVRLRRGGEIVIVRIQDEVEKKVGGSARQSRHSPKDCPCRSLAAAYATLRQSAGSELLLKQTTKQLFTVEKQARSALRFEFNSSALAPFTLPKRRLRKPTNIMSSSKGSCNTGSSGTSSSGGYNVTSSGTNSSVCNIPTLLQTVD